MMNYLSKPALRKHFLKQRLALSPSEWQKKSLLLCNHLKNTPPFCQARCILAYFSFRQEPDLSPLLHLPDKVWGFSRTEGENLVWHRWQLGDPVEENSYKIQQPLTNAPFLRAQEVDLILIPALACDRRGYRLGYGGGFYDRLLAAPEWQSLPTLGIIFHSSLVGELPFEPWDQPLGGVCTDYLVSWIMPPPKTRSPS
jgi:5-formyltetrahydrofolate cyclo-ligase